MKKFAQYLSGFVPFFVAEGIQIILAMILSAIYFIFYLLKGLMDTGKGREKNFPKLIEEIQRNLLESNNVMYSISVLGILLCGMIFFFWYRKLKQGDEKEEISQKFHWKMIGYIFLLGYGSQLVITGILSLIEPYFPDLFNDYGNKMNKLVDGNILLVLFFIIIIAPVTEELIFRGVILYKMKQNVSMMGAITLQAILFGIYHWNIIQGIYAFFMGLVFGYIAMKFRSVVASILLHCVINASSFTMFLFKDTVPIMICLLFFGSAFIGLSFLKIKSIDVS